MDTASWLDVMIAETVNNVQLSALEEAKIYSVRQIRNVSVRFKVNRFGTLSPAAARSILRKVAHGTLRRNIAGLWVKKRSDAQALVNAVVRSRAGVGVVRERHGMGRPHFHIVWPNGRSTHVWFGSNLPKQDFFE